MTIFVSCPHSFMTDVTIPSVYPSVTRCYCMKTAKRIVEILSLNHSHTIPALERVHPRGTSYTEG